MSEFEQDLQQQDPDDEGLVAAGESLTALIEKAESDPYYLALLRRNGGDVERAHRERQELAEIVKELADNQ